MSFNPAGAVEASLDVFGSWVTEMAPENLPPGVSPDNQDVAFEPGSVGSRAALQRVFNSPFPDGGSPVYAKSFVSNTGQTVNLYLTSLGTLYTENVTSSPGTLVNLFTVAAGSKCKSVTAFGREYLALSDGLHGSDIPLQYDGTYLDRVTMDGPGAPPTVSNYTIPAVPMLAVSSGGGPAVNITSVVTTGLVRYRTQDEFVIFYTTLTFTTATPHGLAVGQSVTVAGVTWSGSGAALPGTVTVSSVTSSTVFVTSFYDPDFDSGTGGTISTAPLSVTMTRFANTVTVTTNGVHNLSVGFQAQITGIPTASVGSISSIVVNNEDNPGVATVTTSSAHGLVPGINVLINGVAAVGVGGAIVSVVRHGQVVTCTTTTANNLVAGSIVTVAGVTDTSFNGVVTVLNVVSATVFTYIQASADATSSAGTISLAWPVSTNTLTPTYWTILTCPTTTSFTVQLTYGDGTWTSGTVSYPWDGIFYVSAVPTATSFQYQQYGPNATSSTVGTVTPYGQISAGQHQMRCSFLTRQGYLTRPSPPVTFQANGGQYLQITGLPIGPSNVAARVLEFTGASGAYFFYLPVPAQVNGQQVSTVTQINDNVTSNVIVDFGDPSLFGGIGTSIPGNNTPAQAVIDGALGFGFYNLRLTTYGQRNTVQRLLNMGFNGGPTGAVGSSGPSGWSQAGSTGGTGYVINSPRGIAGFAYQMTSAGGVTDCLITQPAFEDAYGNPILYASTYYSVRVWAQTSNPAAAGYLIYDLYSPGLVGVVAGGSFPISSITTAGGFISFPWGVTTAAIPADAILRVYLLSVTNGTIVTIENGSLYYTQTPYRDTTAFGSYVNNPEAFDTQTGVFGAATDTRKLMHVGLLRSVLYLLTREPSGRLHEIFDNGTSEPSGWTVNEVEANCGALSAFGVSESQADDSSASGGEEWMAWASESGARIFGGSVAHKISQEIQPNWYDPSTPVPWVAANSQINMAAATTIWVLNDPVARLLYFGLPIGAATAPSLIYAMSYRELDTAENIAAAPPFHPSLSGKLIATDNTRKWTRWNIATKGPAARMYRSSTGQLTTVFLAGTNCYTQNPARYTDDDFGQINPYYISAFLPTHDQEQALQLDAGRKVLKYFAASVSSISNVVISVYRNSLSNLYPYSCIRTPGVNPLFDLEWGGGSCTSQRMAFKFSASPIALGNSGYTNGTDVSFSLRKMIPWLSKARVLVRGSAV